MSTSTPYANGDLRKRTQPSGPELAPDIGFSGSVANETKEPHPAGAVKHGGVMQILRMLLIAAWFNGVCASICITQIVGTPLYWYNQDLFYAYIALTKQSFGLLITTVTQWFCPTVVRVSGDASVRGQLRRTKNGDLECRFPERMVLLANHQLYTDWLYLWWIAYTSKMHGHLYIILKEELKYVPILGTGMMYFGFIFMSRKWAADKPRLQHRLGKLKASHAGPMSGSSGLDPMWLLIYPEGTNLSANTRKKSKAWAEKQGIPDFEHQVLPRSTGLHFCLNELKGTVEWVYDCTVGYEGIPKGGYAQDYFTLRSTFFEGRPPKSVNMYWRRFAVADIPLHDDSEFEAWVMQRWQEKEKLLAGFKETGRFPADHSEINGAKGDDFIETQVQVSSWTELAQIFVVPGALALLANVLAKSYNLIRSRERFPDDESSGNETSESNESNER